jgi:hypothetical protein
VDVIKGAAAAEVAATGSGVNAEEVTRAAPQEEEVNAIQIHSSTSWKVPSGKHGGGYRRVSHSSGAGPAAAAGEDGGRRRVRRGRPRRRGRTRGDDKWACVHGEKRRNRDEGNAFLSLL